MIVSQVPPSLISSSGVLDPTLIPLRSSFLMSRRILPPGVWIASLAGFFPATVPLAELPLALEALTLIADDGRAKGTGLVDPGFDAGVRADCALLEMELGCCLMAKTKVLFRANC